MEKFGDMENKLSKYALPKGSSLRNGEYIIKEAVSKGSSSIVYKADQFSTLEEDNHKILNVIIKEYCPETYLSDVEAGNEGLMTRRTSANDFVFSDDAIEESYLERIKSFKEHTVGATVERSSMLEPVIGCFYENNTIYTVMEDKNADTLEERIRNGRITPQESIELIVCLLDAVEQLHESGLCHSDLKPSNILIHSKKSRYNSFDEITLIDFGGVRAFDEKLIEYTEHYSPTLEELSDMSGIEHDMYSIGVILYETVCGITDTRKSFSTCSYNDIRRDINKSIDKLGFRSRNNEYVDKIAETIFKLVFIPAQVDDLSEVYDLLYVKRKEMADDIEKKEASDKRHYLLFVAFFLLLLMTLYVGRNGIPITIPSSTASEITNDSSDIPVVEEAPVETPAAEESPVETPVVEEAPVEAPVAEESPVEVPVVDEVPVEAPMVEDETVETPVVEDGTVEIPVVEEETVNATAGEKKSTFKIIISELVGEIDENGGFNMNDFNSNDITYEFSSWKKIFIQTEGETRLKRLEIEYGNNVTYFEDEGDYFIVQLSDHLIISPSDDDKTIRINAIDIDGNVDTATIELVVFDEKTTLPVIALYQLYGDHRIAVDDTSEISLSELDSYSIVVTDREGLSEGGVFLDGEEVMGIIAMDNLEISVEPISLEPEVTLKLGMELVVIMNDNDGNTCALKTKIVK